MVYSRKMEFEKYRQTRENNKNMTKTTQAQHLKQKIKKHNKGSNKKLRVHSGAPGW